MEESLGRSANDPPTDYATNGWSFGCQLVDQKTRHYFHPRPAFDRTKNLWIDAVPKAPDARNAEVQRAAKETLDARERGDRIDRVT